MDNFNNKDELEKEEIQIEERNKPNSIKKNLFLVVIILIVVLVVMLSTNDVGAIFEVIKKTDYRFVGIGILFVLGFWLLQSLSIHLIMRKKTDKKIGHIDSMAIANSVFFFNGITPFSSGGQPFQIYSYHKCGIKSGICTAVIMMNFIIYQIALNLVSFVALGFYFVDLSNKVSNFKFLVIVGVTINILVLAGLILMSISNKFRKLLLGLIGFVCKIKFLRKHRDKILNKVSTFIEEAQLSFKSLFKEIGLLIITLLLQILALVLNFIVPYFIFLALGINVGIEQLLLIMSLSAFALTFMIWIPTPGASGGAEFAFTELFPSMVVGVTAGPIAVSATLLWRFITYYLAMLFGFINFIIFEKRHKNDTKKLEE